MSSTLFSIFCWPSIFDGWTPKVDLLSAPGSLEIKPEGTSESYLLHIAFPLVRAYRYPRGRGVTMGGLVGHEIGNRKAYWHNLIINC
jgi:hypothetical protein